MRGSIIRSLVYPHKHWSTLRRHCCGAGVHISNGGMNPLFLISRLTMTASSELPNRLFYTHQTKDGCPWPIDNSNNSLTPIKLYQLPLFTTHPMCRGWYFALEIRRTGNSCLHWGSHILQQMVHIRGDALCPSQCTPPFLISAKYTHTRKSSPKLLSRFMTYLFSTKNDTPVMRICFNAFIKYCGVYRAVTRLRHTQQSYTSRNNRRVAGSGVAMRSITRWTVPLQWHTPPTSTEERCFMFGPLTRLTELPGFEYLPHQHSHSCIRIQRDSWPHFTVSDTTLPQPGGPGPCIYIPKEQSGPVTPRHGVQLS
jgi:hypothetical protein